MAAWEVPTKKEITAITFECSICGKLLQNDGTTVKWMEGGRGEERGEEKKIQLSERIIAK